MFSKAVFAENLQKARLRLGLSRNEFAKKAGLSFSQLYRYENEIQVPGSDKVLAICEITGQTPNELLGWNEEGKE